MRRATCTICRVLAVAAVFLIMFQSGQVEPVSSVGFSPSDAEFDGLQSVYFTPPEERWLGGVDFDGDFFYGGADYAKELFDWGYLDPVADVDSFCSVEVRFSTTTTQKAYRYIRGGADNWGYDGYYEVPFTVWDIDSNRQLNAAFVEWVDSDVFDSTWGPSADPDLLGGREYLFVMNTDYSGEDYTNATIPYWTYNLLTDEL
ncbi:MAG: hypothetical protein GY867_01390, partial [bacterium]|nr:hypothetical protein [bacterium]